MALAEIFYHLLSKKKQIVPIYYTGCLSIYGTNVNADISTNMNFMMLFVSELKIA